MGLFDLAIPVWFWCLFLGPRQECLDCSAFWCLKWDQWSNVAPVCASHVVHSSHRAKHSIVLNISTISRKPRKLFNNTYCCSEGISRILKDSSNHLDEKNIPPGARKTYFQPFSQVGTANSYLGILFMVLICQNVDKYWQKLAHSMTPWVHGNIILPIYIPKSIMGTVVPKLGALLSLK